MKKLFCIFASVVFCFSAEEESQRYVNIDGLSHVDVVKAFYSEISGIPGLFDFEKLASDLFNRGRLDSVSIRAMKMDCTIHFLLKYEPSFGLNVTEFDKRYGRKAQSIVDQLRERSNNP